MAFDYWNNFGPGAIGKAFGGMFGGDPSDEANKYIGKIPGRTAPYFDPFINRGNQAGNTLQGEYGKLIGNPGEMLNHMGEGYKESPGFNFQLQKALEGSRRAAAAGGMAGSPAHELENMEIGTQLANQDYYNWLNKTLGLYGEGLHGEEGMYGTGFNASKSMADMIAQMLAQQGAYGYAGSANRNSGVGSFLGGAIGTGASFL